MHGFPVANSLTVLVPLRAPLCDSKLPSQVLSRLLLPPSRSAKMAYLVHPVAAAGYRTFWIDLFLFSHAPMPSK
jgi:hypothetical protein